MIHQEATCIFVDANVALHFKRPDQIDWCALVNSMRVELLAAPILLRELEKQKVHNHSRKLRQRAGEYIKWLAQFVRDPGRAIRPDTSWNFLAVEPTLDFPGCNLSPTLADDQLIASVLCYKAENARSVYIATADIGLEIKLRSRGLQPLLLPDDLRLPEEPDPLEQENRNLRRQLTERNTPLLALTAGASGQHTFAIAPEVTVPSAPTLEQVCRDNPRIPVETITPTSAAQVHSTEIAQFAAGIGQAMRPSVDRYNNEREKFLTEYEQYLAELKIWEEQRALAAQIELSLRNAGTAPASDIDVALWFPDDLTLLTEDDLPKKPRPVAGLVSPVSFAGFMGMTRNTLGLYESSPRISVPAAGSSVRIDSRAHKVSYWLRNLKHGFTKELRGAYFCFADRQGVRSFSVDYQVSATELPTALSGKLHFVLSSDR